MKAAASASAAPAQRVLIDGKPVSSCLTLATNIEDKEVTTIEGLSRNGELDPVQQAFLKHQAFQCGFCTSGMIMAVKGLVTAHPIRPKNRLGTIYQETFAGAART